METRLRELYRSIIDEIFSQPLISPGDLPNIDVYMDQLTTFMDERLRVLTRDPENDKVLTKTMINNYTKNDLLPPPVKKKYSRNHLILLIYIFYLKNNLSIDDINELIRPLKALMSRSGDEPGALTLFDVYRSSLLWSDEEETHLREELDRIFEKSSATFSDADPQTRGELQRFSFLIMLAHEIQIRKALIQKILDAYKHEHAQTHPKGAKKKKERSE